MTLVAVYLLQKLCCCCIKKDGDTWFARRNMSLQKFKIAREKLNGEVDMKNIITFLRISKLMQKMWLSRRQRLSVPYFRCYTIEDYQVEQSRSIEKRGITEKRIISECEPDTNDLDKRILYELTGIKLDPADYQDESSAEEDISVVINNIIGYDSAVDEATTANRRTNSRPASGFPDIARSSNADRLLSGQGPRPDLTDFSLN